MYPAILFCIIFDSSGEVVTNTLPATLTEKLVSQLNLAANLQYTGQRWYDAGARLHLQPGAFGGAPAGSGPMGVPGLPGGHAYIPRTVSGSSSTFVGGVFTALVEETTGYYAGEVSKSLANHFFYPGGTLSLEAARGTLARTSLLPFFQEVGSGTQGRYRFVSQNIAAEVEQNVYRTLEGEMIDLQGLVGNRYVYRRWLQGLTFTPSSRWTRIANFGMKNALPFGIDAAWQLATDWNTDMPVGHRIARAGIAGGVGLGVGVVVEIGLGAALGTTPPGWLVIGVGVIAGLTFEEEIVDVIYDLVGIDQE